MQASQHCRPPGTGPLQPAIDKEVGIAMCEALKVNGVLNQLDMRMDMRGNEARGEIYRAVEQALQKSVKDRQGFELLIGCST